MASLGLRMPSNTTRRTLKTHSHSHIKSHLSFVESLSHIYMMAEFFLLCLSTGSQSIDHCHSVQSVENTGGSSASAYQLLIQLLSIQVHLLIHVGLLFLEEPASWVENGISAFPCTSRKAEVCSCYSLASPLTHSLVLLNKSYFDQRVPQRQSS